jgi:hypothetical protein
MSIRATYVNTILAIYVFVVKNYLLHTKAAVYPMTEPAYIQVAYSFRDIAHNRQSLYSPRRVSLFLDSYSTALTPE